MNHREFFDKAADDWDKERDKEELKKIAELIQEINIKDNELILDVGTGTGVLFPFLEKSKVIGIDISYKMLKKAQAKNKNRYTLIQADVQNLPFAEERFSRTVLFAVFPHIKNKSRALGELHRVIKSNGEINILHSASKEEINNFHKNFGGVIGNDLIPDQTEMINLLADVGFSDIKILEYSDCYIATGKKI